MQSDTEAERPVIVPIEDDFLVGVLHLPSQQAEVAILIVVGGPQYRVGSHRQFVHLARFLAGRGIAVLRFDYRGLGDSPGAQRSFEDIDADIGAAAAALRQAVNPRKVVLWGLCDAATAISFFAGKRSESITGVVLVNPWVRTDSGKSTAMVKHYYREKVFSSQFWAELLRGKVRVMDSVKDFARHAWTAMKSRLFGDNADAPDAAHRQIGELPDRMLRAMKSFEGKQLIVLSGQDLTANEFKATVLSQASAQRLLSSERAQLETIELSDHTFSRDRWRQELAALTAAWCLQLADDTA